MRRHSLSASILRVLAGLFALLIMLGASSSGCEDNSGKESTSSDGSSSKSDVTAGHCPAPGPKTSRLLPQFDEAETRSQVRVLKDPCLGFVGLLDQVLGLIPEAERSTVDRFTTRLKGFVGKVAKADDIAECGYETDRLAIAIYQDTTYLWSVGVVAVIRGNALVDVAACFLLKQIQAPFPHSAQRSPRPSFCFGATTPTAEGERYTLIWLGSSDWICSDLRNELAYR